MNHHKSKLHLLVLIIFFTTLLNANKVIDFDLIKKGKENNNTLLIIGGIQGDEPGGFISASLIATHYDITKGSVWVVPNLNFYSILKRSRGPYGDMNRKFAYLSKKDPEYKTVQRIKSYIKDSKVKLIVNLHDGSGFYRTKYIDSFHSPYRWGQSSIIDQKKINSSNYRNSYEISSQIVEHINKHLLKKEHRYHIHNTHTREGDKEMEKSLTYYAINEKKSAFGNEASKNLPTYQRVYYHLLALEKYMDIMGIEYKRKFKLTKNGVYNAINNDIHISFYGGKIKLPLSKIRRNLKYFPIKKNGKINFKASNPLMKVIKSGNYYTIQYGNRRLSRLKADYLDYDLENQKVAFEVDGKLKYVNFGDIIDVKHNFLVKDNKDYRINIIGYTNRRKKETNIKVKKSQFSKCYSIDKNACIYRVEYYKKSKFAGMVLIRFR